MEAIKIEKLNKRFKNTCAVQDISISCEKGNIYGIMGHNGSGKTVLLKCICGFLQPDSGSIWINGKNLKEHPDMVSTLGIIIENPAFLSNESGFKNLQYLYTIQHPFCKNHIWEIMVKAGLDPLSKKHVKHYSLGMKQRLAIAQAIMEDQTILILDEPMNGLDKKGIQDMRQIFLEYKEQGGTILMASHNKEDIDALCDQVFEMENGKLI